MRHIGVDLGKVAFTACVLDQDKQQQLVRLPMTREGLAAFRGQLQPDDRVAVEAGPNAYFFYDQVRPAVAEVVLVNPRQFAVIATSTKKTDREDARALARFLKLGCLPTATVPDATIRELRQLFTTRETLVHMTTQLRNMGHAALVRNGIGRGRGAFAKPESRRRLARLEGLPPSDRLVLELVLRQIEQLEAEIVQVEREIIRRGRQLRGLKRLLQVRGLSLVSAIGILVEIGDITRFASAKQLVGYAGLASAVRQSGALERHGSITKQGRTLLRTFLVQAVLSMVRNPSRTPLGDFYLRKQREKGSGKAICATARKLLALIFVLLTKDLDYWFLEERLYQRKLRMLARAAA
jgi:transposase